MAYTLQGKIARAHPYQLDTTLTVEGAGAEAKATGERIKEAKKIAEDHIKTKNNPHNVTKAQLGLDQVDNTPDTQKPVSALQAKAIKEVKDLANEKATTVTLKATILADGWSDTAPFVQYVAVSGLLSTDYPFVDIDLSDVTEPQSVIECWNMVGRVTVNDDNSIVAYCFEEKPTVDIPVVFKVVR